MEEAGFHFEQGSVGSRRKNKKIRPIVILVLLLILAGIIIFLINWYFNSQSKSTKDVVATPTPTEMPTPTFEPTATPEANISPTGSTTKNVTPTTKPTTATGSTQRGITVTVLNGSGEAGVGSKMADYLKGLGYTVSSTGNADNFDYKDVVIELKPASSKYLSILKSDISAQYTVGSTSAALSSGSTDAVVIVGK